MLYQTDWRSSMSCWRDLINTTLYCLHPWLGEPEVLLAPTQWKMDVSEIWSECRLKSKAYVSEPCMAWSVLHVRVREKEWEEEKKKKKTDTKKKKGIRRKSMKCQGISLCHDPVTVCWHFLDGGPWTQKGGKEKEKKKECSLFWWMKGSPVTFGWSTAVTSC